MAFGPRQQKPQVSAAPIDQSFSNEAGSPAWQLQAIEFSWREFTICELSQQAKGTGNPHPPEYQALRARPSLARKLLKD
jgi:hypothetical protein